MTYLAPTASASAPLVIRAAIGPPQSSYVISSSSHPLSYFPPYPARPPRQLSHPPPPCRPANPAPLSSPPSPLRLMLLLTQTIARRPRESDEKIRLEVRSVSRLKNPFFTCPTSWSLPAPHALLSASEPPPPPHHLPFDCRRRQEGEGRN